MRLSSGIYFRTRKFPRFALNLPTCPEELSMKHTTLPNLQIVTALLVTLALGVNSAWSTAVEKIVHQFNQTPHGSFQNGVVGDAAGNLYGTAIYGGTYNHGLVFKLTPNSHGGWTETLL